MRRNCQSKAFAGFDGTVCRCEVVALCDIKVERAEKAKKDFSLDNAKVYEGYKQLLADPEIDVVQYVRQTWLIADHLRCICGR